MARTDYGAILSTVIKDTSDSIREVNETSALIAPNEWGGLIRAMHSDSEYQSALAGLDKKTIENVPIASFNALSGVKLDSLKVLVTAQQDLHGYDKPWAGGGGKNKANLNVRAETVRQGITSQVYADNRITASGTSSGNGDIGITFANNITFESGETYTLSLSGTDTRSGQLAVIFHESGGSYVTALYMPSGTHSISFTKDGTFDGVLLRTTNTNTITLDAKMQIEKGSSATSYAPYENICPITGWSGANVTRSGANIWNGSVESGDISVTINGADHTNANRMRTVGYVRVKPNTSYYWAMSTTYANCIVAFYDKDQNYPSNVQNVGWQGRPTNGIFTTPSWCYYIRFYFNATSATYNNDLSINYPSTDTAYHAYNGNTYTIAFGDTYYGGELDVTNGVLRVKGALYTTTWTQFNQNNGYKAYRSSSYIQAKSYDNAKSNMIGTFGSFSSSSMNKNIIQLPIDSPTFVYMALDENADPTAVQIYYELATPIEIQLTAQQIAQLAENNIWADTGDVSECVYYASGSEPQYDITQICDNSSYSSTLTLMDSYSNYDFLKIVIYNSDDSKEYTIFTIPSVLDQIATYGNNLVNFNTVMETNIYCAYTMTSSSTWTRYGNRNSNIKAIYGYKATNKTVSVTPIYARQNINTSSVTPTSTTSLYDYDIIFLATCSGAVDETQPCNNVIYPKGKFNGIPHYFILNKYLGATCVAMTEFTLGANSNYFGVYGIKFE